MTTVLLTAMLLVAMTFVVGVATLALAARAHRCRQLADARTQARHWVERLGGELLVLDGAANVRNTDSGVGNGPGVRQPLRIIVPSPIYPACVALAADGI